MPAQTVFTVGSTSDGVVASVAERWHSLDRGWKAAVFGLAIVLGHLVAPL